MRKHNILIVDADTQLDSITKAFASVIVSCKDGICRIVKDRTGKAFNTVFTGLDNLNTVLNAIYPDYLIEDCRV